MGDRILLALLAFIVGVLVGVFSPLSQLNQPEQTFINPPTPTSATIATLTVPRAVVVPNTVPPTLARPPTSTPGPSPTPEPAHTYVIKLRGGGEMTVVATDLASALNNVKEQGGDPADQP